MAGGGGGAGSGLEASEPDEGIFGGAGGSANGIAGGNGGQSEFRELGFQSQEAAGGEGGAAGSAGKGGAARESPCTGGDGAGGIGGSGTLKTGNCGSSGGGGGGYFGGGAGGASNNASGGGGAGSSYIAPGATGGVTSGAGEPQEVVITYTVPSPPKAAIGSPAGGATFAQGALVRTEFSCLEGAGGPGVESCKDSDGGSGTSGTLDTASPGSHTYTVTADSKDGLTSEATVNYTVVASPGAPAAAASHTIVAAQETPVKPKPCISQRKLAIHVAEHVILPAGTRIRSAKVLLAGRLVTRLKGPQPVAHLNLAGLGKGTYRVTIVARTSRGKSRTAFMTLHTCISSKGK